MSRVLLVGVGPLPAPGRQRVHAPGLRLETFLRILQRADVRVLLGEIYFTGVRDAFEPRTDPCIDEHRLLGPERDAIPSQIDEWIASKEVDAVVALTDVGCEAAARTSFAGPFLADFFGHPMAERMQQGSVHGNNEALADQWLLVLPTLLRADRFSVNSKSQRLALVGELGAAGRLNAQTCGHELIEIIPPTLPFHEPLPPPRHDLAGHYRIPNDARIVLSTGGYNTWVDEETLFLALEEAMRIDPELHFVSTGGAIEGHVEIVYTRFTQRVAKSPMKERFHLLGWIPHDDLLGIMQLAHVGVNCDRWSLEGELGCRNRLLGWLWAGMRAVTTVTSDATRELVDQGWARAVDEGDWCKLAAAIVDEAARGRSDEPEADRQRLLSQWSGEQFDRGVVEWVRNPAIAPDRAADKTGVVNNPLAQLQRRFLSAADSEMQTEKLRQAARRLLDRLEGSRALRLYLRTNPETARQIETLRRHLRNHEK